MYSAPTVHVIHNFAVFNFARGDNYAYSFLSMFSVRIVYNIWRNHLILLKGCNNVALPYFTFLIFTRDLSQKCQNFKKLEMALLWQLCFEQSIYTCCNIGSFFYFTYILHIAHLLWYLKARTMLELQSLWTVKLNAYTYSTMQITYTAYQVYHKVCHLPIISVFRHSHL